MELCLSEEGRADESDQSDYCSKTGTDPGVGFQEKNIQEIVKVGSDLYDKFAGSPLKLLR